MKIFSSSVIKKKLLDSPYRVKGLVIEPDSGKLLSIAVRPKYERLVSFSDLEWVQRSKSFRLLDCDAVFERKDLARSDKVICEGKILKKQKIVCENGRFVGVLKDFEIDTTLGVLTQIQTRRFWFVFGRSTLIARKHILEIGKNMIKVDEDVFCTINAQKKAEPMAPPA